MNRGKLDLDSETETSFDQSLLAIKEHHYTIRKLTVDLKHFEASLNRQLETNHRVVESPIRNLISLAKEFLALCRRDGSAEHVPYCLAAVDYLVCEDDAVPDFECYDGFEDDRQVFEAVIQKFNLHSAKKTA